MKLLIILLCVALSGCGHYIVPTNYTKAEEFCKVNGGLGYIDVKFLSYEVFCNNGLRIDISKVVK